MKTLRNKKSERPGNGGFSMIEVSLALLLAATGLLAVFALFPASLRMSEESRADMVESTFASSVLETIAGNVRQIDDIADWNDPETWWKVASDNGSVFGGAVRSATAEQFRDAWESGSPNGYGNFSLSTVQVAGLYKTSANRPNEIFYYGNELFENEVPAGARSLEKLNEPPQWLLRLQVVRRTASPGGDSRLPNRYVATVVSTTTPKPEQYVRNASYSREFTFLHRP